MFCLWLVGKVFLCVRLLVFFPLFQSVITELRYNVSICSSIKANLDKNVVLEFAGSNLGWSPEPEGILIPVTETQIGSYHIILGHAFVCQC